MPRFARYLSRAIIETFVRRYLTSVFLSVPGKVCWTTLRCQPFFFSFGEKKIRESDRKFSRNNFVVLTEEQQADRRDLFSLFFLPSFLPFSLSFFHSFLLSWLVDWSVARRLGTLRSPVIPGKGERAERGEPHVADSIRAM